VADKVGIVMGSASDKATMSAAEAVLKDLGIESEMRVLSAHRTPEQLVSWIRRSEKDGVRVFIAGAGLAAALPGTVAAHTTYPVIGVPLSGSASIANGLDALLSIVQMPPGIPVGCVAIGEGGARNAAFLAAQILSLGEPALQDKIKAQRKAAADKILSA